MNSCENCMYQKQPEYCELSNKKLYGFCGNFTEGRTMITNEEARKAIEKYQKEHPLQFRALIDVTTVSSKEGADIISQTIEQVAKKVDEDTELWCICEMAKMYMQGVRPVYPVKQESEWIPVSERLPEALQTVLVTSKGGYVYTSCIAHGDWEYGGEVVAWQPLPEPYKKGEEE